MPIFLRVYYTDLLGVLRYEATYLKEAPKPDKLPTIFFDGSSVYGFGEIQDSDLALKPDPGTLSPAPNEENVYEVIANVYYPRGDRYPADPRYLAERANAYALENGFKPVMGVEVEFFIFDSVRIVFSNTRQAVEVESIESPWQDNVAVPPKKAYHVSKPIDTVSDHGMEIASYMEIQGYRVTKVHHEVASAGQLEVSSEALDPVRLGDFTQFLKKNARLVAKEHGRVAVFLPKPLIGDNGSGMHVHVSLWSKSGENLFYDESDEYGLSQLARYFIGGVLEHGESLSAIVSPTVNSYKRLVPGYEAPVYLAWGVANRSAAIRVPKVEKPSHARIEYRSPDPSANPYLAYAAILLAGLDGIKKKIEPPEPAKENVYHWSEKELRERNVRRLPRNLWEALEKLESDNEYLKPVFSRTVLETYIELKKKEILEVEYNPTPAEFYYYTALF